MKLCFATNNAHKIEEIRALVDDYHQILSLQDVGCNEELAEEQDTLEGNSNQKAAYVFKNYNTACFADDTGLEVTVLNNAPGVYSARYAGNQRSAVENMNLLLKNLEGNEERRAQFRTVITLITPKLTKQFEGIVKGTIIKEKRGVAGFGYDPIFLPDGFSRTLAEMTMEEKNKISHRSRAVKKLIDFLNQLSR